MTASSLRIQHALLHSGAFPASATSAQQQQAATQHPLGGWCGGGRPPAEKLLHGAPPPPDIGAVIPTYWRRLDSICPEAERGYKPCAERDPAQRSSPAHVAVQPFAFGGLGVWNTLSFATATANGQRKSRGGDTWTARLLDDSTSLRIPARMFDQVGSANRSGPTLRQHDVYRRCP